MKILPPCEEHRSAGIFAHGVSSPLLGFSSTRFLAMGEHHLVPSLAISIEVAREGVLPRDTASRGGVMGDRHNRLPGIEHKHRRNWL